MKDIVIVAAARTAVGRAKRGMLVNVRPDDLAAIVLNEVIQRAPGVKKEDVEDVVIGCAFPEHTQGLNMGRLALMKAGFPYTTSGQTVNRFCSSGLQAIAIGAQQIMAGMCEVVAAGGAESMSQVPMTGFYFAPNPGLVEEYPEPYMGMGLTAEAVAERYNVSREEQDRFGLQSNAKALAAIADGKFREEIVPVEVKTVSVNSEGKRVEKIKKFDVDEGPRQTTLEQMASLKPPFKKGGSVTAGNSSQMSDGAAAVLLMTAEKAAALKLNPLARYVGFAVAGVPPEIMGVGPMYAIPQLMKVTGRKLKEVDLFEINEAFASQALASVRELGIDEGRVNVNGGAIALGHPLGCTGAKLTVQLIHEMKRRGARYGVVSMCIGGGMGAAGIFENLT
ncbi:MAG: thiolase family protein [Deltaproteobacteria bacterium]|nr:thiolase family protein [Deltaproteobacteria bacterium]